MEGVEELTSHLSGKSRVIVIAEKDVDLRPQAGENRLFLLKIAEGSLAAGGRGGGIGERKVVEVVYFELKGGLWTKLFRTDDDESLAGFEVPYYVSRLPLTLVDGTESMGYGVVEPDLVREFARKAGIPSSA
ncbi:MAG TPA: hypothetical protein VK126_04420 [Nitrososphaerales archaeon]|nr:hypothetical protein [Nitrososphaerales archaeon]